MAQRASKTTKTRKKKKTPPKPKKPAKLGYTIAIDLPTSGRSNKAGVTILDKNKVIVATFKADLGDDRERTRLANKLIQKLKKVTSQHWEDALQKAHLSALAQQAFVPQNLISSAPISLGSCYIIEAGCMCLKRSAANGDETIIQLCNFTAKVIETVRVDDGSSEIEYRFTLEGNLYDGKPLPVVTIKSSDYATMNWPVTSWGLVAIVSAGQSCRDHLRAAIQWNSHPHTTRILYKHTGWRHLNGEWIYLHAQGGINSRGADDTIAVELDDSLSRFALPVPPSGNELIQAVRASLGLRHLSCRIMAPILGGVYRSVLGPADCSIHVAGHTGLGKSEILALAQQHVGAGMDRLNLPGSWSSTGNSLESLAFLAKDAPLVVDDFKPGGSKGDIDRIHQLADRVLRAQGNRSGRGRCHSDGTVRSSRPPRGLILSSGEDVPRGESLQARLCCIQISNGEIDLRSLTPYQQEAAQGRYAAAMAGYISWLAGRYDQVLTSIPQERAILRDKATLSNCHARTPNVVADLALGWKYFLDFATEVGAINPVERDQIAKEVWNALTLVAAEQTAEIAAQDPANRFIKLLVAALAAGRVHVTNREGGEPSQSESWGWKEESGSGCSKNPQGKQVGWVDGDDLYLEPEVVFAEVQQLGEDQGERLSLTRSQLFRRLKETGNLVSFENNKTTNRRTLQGREHSILHLNVAILSATGTGSMS